MDRDISYPPLLQTGSGAPGPVGAPRTQHRHARGLMVMSVAGELMITVAVVLFLFAIYTFAWTNVRASSEAGSEVKKIQESWGSPEQPAAPTVEPGKVGSSMALLYLPKLGQDWVQPITEGTGRTGTKILLSDLSKGLAHYPDTAEPGAKGNFAVAGHRATHGEPFRDLDKLSTGDEAVVQTRTAWLVYKVSKSEIVAPDTLDVLAPVPRDPGAPADGARLTLTTCEPRWGSTSRLIVYAEEIDRRPLSSPPAVLLPKG